MPRSLRLLLLVVISLGCGCAKDKAATSLEDTGTWDRADAARDLPDAPGDTTAAPDVRDADATVRDATDTDAGPEAPPWDPRLRDTTELGVVRGLRVARGIVHLHSIHSHDACDYEPRVDGEFNEPCLQTWRDAVCATRQDVVFTTEHEEYGAEVEFEELLLQRRSDRLLLREGEPFANELTCPDGHQVVVLPGGEFDVMPVAMDRHIPGTPEERAEFYENATPGRVTRMKNELGAVVLQAHTESRSVDDLRALNLDGFEIYNLHANIDPEIREEFLGLDPWGFTQGVQPFVGASGPEPDLVQLGFLAPNTPALLAFDRLLWEGRKLVGTGGNDAHQNTIPLRMRDGERVDSYRRMLRFVTHHFLVPELDAEAYEAALSEGRLWVVFESFATPTGLDFHAERDGEVFEMGDTAPPRSTLHVARPVVAGHEDVDVPTQIVLLRAERDGAQVVAQAQDADLVYETERPGAYRVEIRINPIHLTPWLGPEPDRFLVPTPWVYSNPVYVQ